MLKIHKDDVNFNYNNKNKTVITNINHSESLFKAGSDIMTSQTFNSNLSKKRENSLSKTYNASNKPETRGNRIILTNNLRTSSQMAYNDKQDSVSTSSLRMFQKYSSFDTADLNQISKYSNNYFKNKQAINLEDLLIQEERLWFVLVNIRFGIDFNFAAEEYLDFAHMSSIQAIETYFTESKFKEILRINSIHEYVSVMLCVLSFLANKLNESSKGHLKHLLYYVHQNILLVISLILSRMDKNYIDNIWGNKLKEIVYLRRSNEMKDDEQFKLQQNTNIIKNMLQNYIDIYLRNQHDHVLFKLINDSINNSDGITLCTIRTLLSKLKVQMIQSIIMSQAMVNYSNPNLAVPYLPPIDKSRFQYSLILDLDETLIHSDTESNSLLIRPGAEKFLEELSSCYEIIVFTAAMQDYADSIMDTIDKEKKWIQYRLYRQHTTLANNTNIKDLIKLGRDLSKSIIIDNISDNFQRQSDNGIFIKTWIGDKADTALIDLIPLLKEIPENSIKDVRKALRKVRDILIRLYVKGDHNPFETLKNSIQNDKKVLD